MQKHFLVTLTLLWMSCSAHAGIIYNEAVSGDLATFDSTTLNLSSGVNSVLGSSGYESGITDFDGFIVSLGAGLVLDSVAYYISNVVLAGPTTILQTVYGLNDTDHVGSDLTGDGLVDILGASPQSLFTTELPLTSGSIAFTPSSLGRTGDGGTWDYEIQFSVPAPGTLTLFGLGLAGLGWSHRKKA